MSTVYLMTSACLLSFDQNQVLILEVLIPVSASYGTQWKAQLKGHAH